jgi:hypothetical protein
MRRHIPVPTIMRDVSSIVRCIALSYCWADIKCLLQHQVDAAVESTSGAVFCFLPVGTMRTELPVHLNASFKVTNDRRHLWMRGTLSVACVQTELPVRDTRTCLQSIRTVLRMHTAVSLVL